MANNGYYCGVTKAKDAAALEPSTESDADDLTEALLAATIDVFAERGFEGTRVADIAARAGVTTGAVYTRFSGKAELLLAAFDHESGHLLDSLTRSDTPTLDILAMIGSDLLVTDDRTASRLLLESFAAARREPEIADRLRPRLANERMHLAKLVDAEKTNGSIDPSVDTTSVVVFAQAVGIGLQLLRLIDAEMPTPDNWDHLLHQVIGSIVPDSPPEPDPTK